MRRKTQAIMSVAEADAWLTLAAAVLHQAVYDVARGYADDDVYDAAMWLQEVGATWYSLLGGNQRYFEQQLLKLTEG